MFFHNKPQQRAARADHAQKVLLIDFMEENLELARNQFETTDGNNTKIAKWNELSRQLNALGAAKKSSDQWRKYWTDFQSNAKERIAAYQKRKDESGVNGTKKLKPLCELDVRIASIMTISAIDGDQTTQEGGLDLLTMPLALPEVEVAQDLRDEPIPSTSGNIGGNDVDCTPPPQKKNRRTPSGSLLKSADKLRSSQSVRAALANVSFKIFKYFFL